MSLLYAKRNGATQSTVMIENVHAQMQQTECHSVDSCLAVSIKRNECFYNWLVALLQMQDYTIRSHNSYASLLWQKIIKCKACVDRMTVCSAIVLNLEHRSAFCVKSESITNMFRWHLSHFSRFDWMCWLNWKKKNCTKNCKCTLINDALIMEAYSKYTTEWVKEKKGQRDKQRRGTLRKRRRYCLSVGHVPCKNHIVRILLLNVW